jgi:predicted AlkP superfamily phosphohydrolase/phosphomutase
LLNVPATYPAQPLEGFWVSGFDSPRDALDVAYPRDLLQRWEKAGRPYHILQGEIALIDQQNPHKPRGSLEEFVQRWVELTRQQGEMVAWLWKHDPVDMLMTVFTATDSINHRTCDQQQINAVYRAADESLGMILDALDEDTLICLVSDHGSAHAYWYVSIYRLLYDAGWLCFRPEVARHFWRKLPGWVGDWFFALWPRLPEVARRVLSWPLLRLDSRLACDYETIDWSRTQVYPLSSMGSLYINRVGREPEGIVDERTYPKLREQVVQVFSTTCDPLSGRALFSQVLPGEQLYAKAPLGDPGLPDIALIQADYRYHFITGYPSDPLVRPIPDSGEYGTHTPDGIFALAGPGVRTGMKLSPAAIVDVTPTLLAAWEMPIPAEVDGRVLQEVFERPMLEQRMEAKTLVTWEGGVTDKESEEVTERLRDLGYL